MLNWILFLALIAVIVYAGSKLSRYGDALGEKLGLSGSWIGVVLLAAVTSMPEMFAGISASGLVKQADLALGNLFGACVMNMVVVALLGILHHPEPIHRKAGEEQALGASLAIAALGLAGLGLVLSQKLVPVSLFDIGIFAMAIFIFYLVAQRLIFLFEKRRRQASEQREYGQLSLKAVILRFSLAALVIVAAGTALPYVAEGLARQMGWGRSFVGSILMSLATTSPEMVVSISALRMGQVGMALGNLYGSCIFNMSLVFVDDLFYPGSVLAQASSTHVFTALLAITMIAVSLIGLIFRAEKKSLRLMGWDSLIILGLYLLGAVLIFRMGLALG
jgi:cation:H+ antiporter